MYEMDSVVEKLKRFGESLNGKTGLHNKVNGKVINVLGTDYEITVQSAADNPKLKEAIGLCDLYAKKIILSDLAEEELDVLTVDDIEELKKKALRHEIIHAFFGESGLRECSEYAQNEELVDWIAIQLPKILNVINDVGAV